MTEIKTLKDIEKLGPKEIPSDIWVNREKLRAEAVKWINSRISIKFISLLTGNESDDEEIKAKKDLAMYGDGEIRFWMKRFNLKEEDLELKNE